MLPQSWTNSIQLVTSKELCPHSQRQSEILLQFMDALRKFSSLILCLLQGQAHLLKHTCTGWAIPSFPSSPVLIRGRESRQLLNYSINVVGFPSQYSFFQTFCTSEDCTYLRCPHTEIDCSSVESAGEERLTQNAKGVIKGAAQPVEAQVCES